MKTLYIFQVIQAKIEYRWSMKTMLLGIIASVIPFGPFVADARLYRDAPATPAHKD
jgi:integral membrane protein